MSRTAISPSIRFSIFERDRFTCRYCGRSAPAVILELDHVRPVSANGPNATANYATSCKECNRGKGARDLEPFTTPLPKTFAGRFFHLLDETRKIQRQGQIVADHGETVEVRYFEWFGGFPNGYTTLLPHPTRENPERWLFYPTDEAMREGYEHSGMALR